MKRGLPTASSSPKSSRVSAGDPRHPSGRRPSWFGDQSQANGGNRGLSEVAPSPGCSRSSPPYPRDNRLRGSARLLRAKKVKGLAKLDALAAQLEYLPLTTSA